VLAWRILYYSSKKRTFWRIDFFIFIFYMNRSFHWTTNTTHSSKDWNTIPNRLQLTKAKSSIHNHQQPMLPHHKQQGSKPKHQQTAQILQKSRTYKSNTQHTNNNNSTTQPTATKNYSKAAGLLKIFRNRTENYINICRFQLCTMDMLRLRFLKCPLAKILAQTSHLI